ncbi:MAG TPA: CHAT domain-containing protein [Thermoanaerobaculia bacterium]|nr:CHAT domain-containing protein [Thermoanaerobaculia bacterium]
MELDPDPESGWRIEAQQHLHDLAVGPKWAEEKALLVAGAEGETIDRLVTKYPRHARTRIQNILLPAWARSGNVAELELMRAMAAERVLSDPYLRDVVEHAANARAAVVPGILAFEQGFLADRRNDYAAAATAYEEAAAILQTAGSPLALAAGIYAASDAKNSGRMGEVVPRLDAIDQQMTEAGDRYPSMIAESAWLRGLALSQSGDPNGALVAFQRAVAAARQSGEIENEVAVRQLLATEVEVAGDPVEAEQERFAALRLSETTEVDADRTFEAYSDMAFSALRAERPWLAREFAQSQTEIANEKNDPQWIAESDVQRALALLDVRRMSAAASSLDSARGHALLIVDASYRIRVLASIDYVAGRLAQLQSRPRDAVAAYSAAIGNWETIGWRSHTAIAFLSRADANLAAGRRRDAEGDLRAGIAEMEKQRSGFIEAPLRVAYFERAEHLFDRLIGLLADEGRHIDALSVAEQKRARVMLDRLGADGNGIATPLDGRTIASRLPSGVAVLEIAFRDRERDMDRPAELWLVHGGRVVHGRSVALRPAIESAVTQHLAAIRDGDEPAIRRQGSWLYAQLVAPVTRSLPSGTDLIIAADGVLQTLPFATLVTPSDKYLVENHTLAVAPSASVFLASAPVAPAGNSLLAVVQAAPNGLDRLPGAEAEAARIASSHPKGRLLAGKSVTPAEFLDAASRAAWVHFAGHAKVGRRMSQSALLFETAAGPPAELSVATIAGSRLAARPLVILAACSTGRGKLRRNEGVESLAAAFLQAGARGVVATLWDVDDALSARLFRSLHHNLREGARPADALRSAQLALLHSSDPRERSPSVWGSVFVEGTL